MKTVLSLLVIIALSLGISAYLIYIRKKNFVGNLIGAFIVSFIGAILFNYLLSDVSEFFKEKLDINILAVLIGILFSLYILEKLTPK